VVPWVAVPGGGAKHLGAWMGVGVRAGVGSSLSCREEVAGVGNVRAVIERTMGMVTQGGDKKDGSLRPSLLYPK